MATRKKHTWRHPEDSANVECAKELREMGLERLLALADQEGAYIGRRKRPRVLDLVENILANRIDHMYYPCSGCGGFYDYEWGSMQMRLLEVMSCLRWGKRTDSVRRCIPVSNEGGGYAWIRIYDKGSVEGRKKKKEAYYVMEVVGTSL